MKLSSQIKPISYVKANAAELLKRIRKEREPIIITQNGEARAVLMDIESYEKQLEALNLLKAYAAEQPNPITGEAYSFEEAVAELSRRRSGRNAGIEKLIK